MNSRVSTRNPVIHDVMSKIRFIISAKRRDITRTNAQVYMMMIIKN